VRFSSCATRGRERNALCRATFRIAHLRKAWPSVLATPCPASPELCIQARRPAQAPTTSALRMSRTYQPSAWPTPPSSSSLAPGAPLKEGSLPPDRDLHSSRTCATGTKGTGESLRRSRTSGARQRAVVRVRRPDAGHQPGAAALHWLGSWYWRQEAPTAPVRRCSYLVVISLTTPVWRGSDADTERVVNC